MITSDTAITRRSIVSHWGMTPALWCPLTDWKVAVEVVDIDVRMGPRETAG
jgi:hypothetical protein